ncbi:MAG: hypothetical protein LRY75_04935 [Shewanella xiamenensis]|nr:hypothetical protein [Shewanella xiamenensis]
MDIRIIISGLGINIPKTSFGVNAISGCYLHVKNGDAAPEAVYGIKSYLSLGSESSTLIFGQIRSEWMKVVDSEIINKFSLQNVMGKTLDINVSGTVLMKGNADISIKIINEIGDAINILDKYDVSVEGGQLSSTNIRGRAVLMPQKF